MLQQYGHGSLSPFDAGAQVVQVLWSRRLGVGEIKELYDVATVVSCMDASVPKHERYRARALDCLHDAQRSEDRELKDVFHRLAVWWVVLAHEIEDDQKKERRSDSQTLTPTFNA